MERLPDSALEAKRRAAPRAVLRVVPHGEPADRLPADADAFLGRATTPVGLVVKPVLMVAISVGLVWLVTVNAWDHDGFFPWFWNPIWAVFPWVFLAPLWLAFLRSLARRPANARFRRGYATLRGTAQAAAGEVVDTRITRTDTGGTASYVAAVTSPVGDVVVGRLAPGAPFAPHEAPEPGDAVSVWRFPDGWTIVQAARGRARAAAPDGSVAGQPDGSVAGQLVQLAELHRGGQLTDEQYDQAKRRVLEP